MLHGNESPDYCREVQLPVIKVFRVGSDINVEIIKSYDVHAFLFDTFEKDKPGGTGEIFNWDVICNLQSDTPIILSGGLNIENIQDGIDAVSPSAVDVNSGVESKPGIKDKVKVEKLFNTIENSNHIANNRFVFTGRLNEI